MWHKLDLAFTHDALSELTPPVSHYSDSPVSPAARLGPGGGIKAARRTPRNFYLASKASGLRRTISGLPRYSVITP
jgi:hypothetical protein